MYLFARAARARAARAQRAAFGRVVARLAVPSSFNGGRQAARAPGGVAASDAFRAADAASDAFRAADAASDVFRAADGVSDVLRAVSDVLQVAAAGRCPEIARGDMFLHRKLVV